MKKTLLTVAAGIAMLSFASCKKDYTCTCTASGGGLSASTSTTINDTKSDAKEACEKGSSTSTVGGVTFTSTCSITD